MFSTQADKNGATSASTSMNRRSRVGAGVRQRKFERTREKFNARWNELHDRARNLWMQKFSMTDISSNSDYTKYNIQFSDSISQIQVKIFEHDMETTIIDVPMQVETDDFDGKFDEMCDAAPVVDGIAMASLTPTVTKINEHLENFLDDAVVPTLCIIGDVSDVRSLNGVCTLQELVSSIPKPTCSAAKLRNHFLSTNSTEYRWFIPGHKAKFLFPVTQYGRSLRFGAKSILLFTGPRHGVEAYLYNNMSTSQWYDESLLDYESDIRSVCVTTSIDAFVRSPLKTKVAFISPKVIWHIRTGTSIPGLVLLVSQLTIMGKGLLSDYVDHAP